MTGAAGLDSKLKNEGASLFWICNRFKVIHAVRLMDGRDDVSHHVYADMGAYRSGDGDMRHYIGAFMRAENVIESKFVLQEVRLKSEIGRGKRNIERQFCIYSSAVIQP